MKKRLGTLLLILCIIVNCMGMQAVLATGTGEEDVEYNSYTELTYTINQAALGAASGEILSNGPAAAYPDGVWSFMTMRGDNNLETFKAFNGVVQGGKNGSANLNFSSTTDVTDFATPGGNIKHLHSVNNATETYTFGYVAMSQYWTRPNANSANAKSSAAKVFTAPKAGYIEISAKDINGDSKIWGRRLGHNGSDKIRNSGAKVYVIKVANGGTAPTYSDFENMQMFSYKFDFTDSDPASAAKSIDFHTRGIDVAEGDQIFFIVNAADGADAHGKYVHWNPVVKYTTRPAAAEKYNSYTELTHAINQAELGAASGKILQNGPAAVYTGGVWSWEALRGDSKLETFVPFKGVVQGGTNGSGNLNFSSTPDVTDFAEVGNQMKHLHSAGTVTEDNSFGYVAMSEYWTRPNVTNANAKSSAAKVFTAPKSGVIKITAEDINGNPLIWGRRLGDPLRKDGANVYIVRAKGGKAPVYENFDKNNIYSYEFDFSDNTTDKNYAKSVSFEPIEVAVSKGEKLYFIVNAADGANAHAKYVHWNPVVEYTRDIAEDNKTIYCTNAGTADADGSNDKPYTFADAIKFAGDGYTIILKENIQLADGFAWFKDNKHITISGAAENSATKLNWTGANTRNMIINSDVTFENLTFSYTDGVNTAADKGDYNVITCNGNHVVIAETVKSDSHKFQMYGGAGSDYTGDTNLEVYGGNFDRIFGGNNYSHQTGTSNLIVGGSANYMYVGEDGEFLPVIYGGGFGHVTGDVNFTFKGNAKGHKVTAGTSGSGAKPSYVGGKVTLNIEGGEIMNVYAAGTLTNGASIPKLDAEININGGKVEMLSVSEEYVIHGDIVFNYNGGEVTRRIYTGCYNDYDLIEGYKSDYYVNGNVTLVVGAGASNAFSCSDTSDMGIAGSSRRDTNHEEEISKIIFLDDTYSKFANKLYKTFETREADYRVKASANGTVAPVKGSANTIAVTPDAKYEANVELTDGVYTLGEAVTDIEFTLIPMIEDVSGMTYAEGKLTGTVNYNFNEAGHTLLVAVYKDDVLVGISNAQVDSGSKAPTFEVTANLAAGKYDIRAMAWSDLTNVQPLGATVKAEYNVVIE